MGAKASRVHLTVGGPVTASGTGSKAQKAGSELHTVSSTQSSMHEMGVGIGGGMPYATSFLGNPIAPSSLSDAVLQQQQLLILQGQMLEAQQYQQQLQQQYQQQLLQQQHYQQQQLQQGLNVNGLDVNMMTQGAHQNAVLQTTHPLQHVTGLVGVH